MEASFTVCKYIADNSRANIMVVEDEVQADKILAVKHELPHLKAIVQYLGRPAREGVLSWEEVLEMGAEAEERELEDRLRRMAINQCCTLIYTSGTTGRPKVHWLPKHSDHVQGVKLRFVGLDYGHFPVCQI